jgi:hypothetical protein
MQALTAAYLQYTKYGCHLERYTAIELSTICKVELQRGQSVTMEVKESPDMV